MEKKNDKKTRKEIVDASMKLFARRGYHGTSISHIAEATGLTKGALYWYFKGKEDLFLTVLERIKENWRKTVLSRIEEPDAVLEKLEGLFDSTSEMVASNDNPYSMHLFLVAAGAQPEMPEFEHAIKSAYSEHVKIIADTIRTGQEDGEIRRDIDAESAAMGIIGSLDGIVLQARLHPPAIVATAISEMKEHLVRSLGVASQETASPNGGDTAKKTSRKKARKPAPSSLPADQMNLF
jgi:AcrR family transcriptional regulator